eukprot:TRINITY_DN4085_c0_g1_i3.p1 TRINITY_DN4085_c0_g1~~TRINITY_DN4085_c0_g1_i3.p1  ORF type:complete len:201 (-),score=21.99 TRINITY_DN4085_c0_g1_i3:189-791(-)
MLGSCKSPGFLFLFFPRCGNLILHMFENSLSCLFHQMTICIPMQDCGYTSSKECSDCGYTSSKECSHGWLCREGADGGREAEATDLGFSFRKHEGAENEGAIAADEYAWPPEYCCSSTWSPAAAAAARQRTKGFWCPIWRQLRQLRKRVGQPVCRVYELHQNWNLCYINLFISYFNSLLIQSSAPYVGKKDNAGPLDLVG